MGTKANRVQGGHVALRGFPSLIVAVLQGFETSRQGFEGALMILVKSLDMGRQSVDYVLHQLQVLRADLGGREFDLREILWRRGLRRRLNRFRLPIPPHDHLMGLKAHFELPRRQSGRRSRAAIAAAASLAGVSPRRRSEPG